MLDTSFSHSWHQISEINTEVQFCLTCTNSLALQNHPVEDEADVLGGLRGARALFAQQVQDLCGEHRVLTVLDELAQVGQARFFALRVLLDDADDAIHDGPLVIKTALQGEVVTVSLLLKLVNSAAYTVGFNAIYFALILLDWKQLFCSSAAQHSCMCIFCLFYCVYVFKHVSTYQPDSSPTNS